MIDEKITMSLGMISTPADPLPVQWGITQSRTKFNYHRTIQNSGMVALAILLAFVSYTVVSQMVFKTVRIVGTSMVPTLQENASYVLDLWTLRNRQPQRNDIVVLRDPGDHGLAVKRIVAMPGESIHFKNGKVFVNGKQLEEPYLMGNVRTFTYSQAKEQFIMCGQDQYYVMGDNRFVSVDSRAYGAVPRNNLLGLVKLANN